MEFGVLSRTWAFLFGSPSNSLVRFGVSSPTAFEQSSSSLVLDYIKRFKQSFCKGRTRMCLGPDEVAMTARV